MKKKQTEWYKKPAALVSLMCVWVFSSVIAAQLVMAKLMILILGTETAQQPVWIAVYSALSYVVAMALIILVPPRIAKKWGVSRKGLGLNDLPTWTDIGLAPVAFIVSLMLAAGLVALFSLFPWFDASQKQELGFSVFIVGWDRIIAFITLVVVAPIAEEVIFRGWLYGKIREVLTDKVSEKVAIIISILIVSVLFGLVHLQWNVGVNVFALSVVLCGLREITGTIYAGILTHMLKNGVAFYLLYVIGI
ncbi:CPBP family intramembrane metalloprotease [Candidatus Saccharibacteria bacterium]|nr:CPBP family intramembrane metalloprotease [Candidatus Saccharibacteria bacterium]